ncbi:PLD nuclease N-terminal domain-containing protein [Rhodococcoides yunnanense]|jgi:hypothetical protein|uniref:PLD nuclease N-terminal domain-containing protein n=1 Tax=Rhodococcoides yunnanense TaxID=278209 RepID=UPI00095BD931|nr:PLD nuclease N-terminal domain-containing protein [Rhodococcus yunnanensis]MCZ4275338.1 PLD nuclease N-terminal domain-containing protein [Rhodococcus yunnanensis]OLT37158.1 hypothetical protein BJF84_07380 [Rhodococcus sp. CUA-806]
MIPDMSALPTPALTALAIALLLQITLAVISLVVLARTPRERLLFGKKWPWVLIIVLINFIGAILFFAIGRRPARVADTHIGAPTAGSVSQTVQRLYGDDRP